MSSVTARGHMISRGLRGAVLGPAQRLHGATFTVDTTFRLPDPVADIPVDAARTSHEQAR